MSHGDGHNAPLEPPRAPTPEEAVVYLVGEVSRLSRTVEALTEQVSRLTTKVQRPDRIKYSVEEAAERMGRSRTSVYELINAGELDSFTEKNRRYITEEAVQSWERRNRR